MCFGNKQRENLKEGFKNQIKGKCPRGRQRSEGNNRLGKPSHRRKDRGGKNSRFIFICSLFNDTFSVTKSM
jgi:hypothetical protein